MFHISKIILLCTGTLIASLLPAHALEITSTEAKTELNFKRIGSYLGLNSPEAQTFRSNANSYDGLYWVAKLTDGEWEGAQAVVLEIREGADADVKHFVFDITSAEKGKPLRIGLTGPQWEEKTMRNITAWRVQLVGAENTLISSARSFLW